MLANLPSHRAAEERSRMPRLKRKDAVPIEARTAAILERVRAIPEGSVTTYSDIDPAAPRLVGRVLATTNADVPWHRVVRADGVAPIGARQLELLRREGVPLRGERVDLKQARSARRVRGSSRWMC